jgi:hypothetical protein
LTMNSPRSSVNVVIVTGIAAACSEIHNSDRQSRDAVA